MEAYHCKTSMTYRQHPSSCWQPQNQENNRLPVYSAYGLYNVRGSSSRWKKPRISPDNKMFLMIFWSICINYNWNKFL